MQNVEQPLLIVNPKSGAGMSEKLQTALVAQTGAHVVNFFEFMRWSEQELAQQASASRTVFWYSGDGALLTGLRRMYTLLGDCAPAVVALAGGSENVIARLCGTHGKPTDVIAAVTDGSTTIKRLQPFAYQTEQKDATAELLPVIWCALAGQYSSLVLQHIEIARKRTQRKSIRSLKAALTGLLAAAQLNPIVWVDTAGQTRYSLDLGAFSRQVPQWTRRFTLPTFDTAPAVVQSIDHPAHTELGNVLYAYLAWDLLQLAIGRSSSLRTIHHEPLGVGQRICVAGSENVAIDTERVYVDGAYSVIGQSPNTGRAGVKIVALRRTSR